MKKIPIPVGWSMGFSSTHFSYADSWEYSTSNTQLHAIKKGKGVYDIMGGDAVGIDTVEVINGVVHFSESMLVNHLHTFGKYGVHRHSSNRWYLLAEKASELLTCVVKKQPGDYVATLAKLLNVELDTTKVAARVLKRKKIVKSESTAAKYLKGVLQGCPTAKVEWEALPRIKELLKLTHGPVSCEEHSAFITLVKDLRKLSGRVIKTGTWYYTSTQEEFSALVLMQSYSNEVDSCQYFPVHLLKGKAKLAVTSNEQFNVLAKELSERKEFLTNQCAGFSEGVRYFFQLGAEGLVSKRFYGWLTTHGDLVGNNYYNVNARSCTITYPGSDEGISVRPATGRDSNLSVYSNRITVEAHLPKVFTEESLKVYLNVIAQS